MILSDEALSEYQELRRRLSGESLAVEQAKQEALELLRLIAVLQTSGIPDGDGP